MRRLCSVLLLLAVVGALPTLPAGAAEGPLTGKVVALDAGHNETPTETGATNSVCTASDCTTLEERWVNWDVVLATKAKLEALGARVALLHTMDEYVDRPTRYQRAADAGAQVLVSVHHNGSADPLVNYTVTYYTQKSDQRVASLAQQHLVAQLGFMDNGIRRDGFGMTVRPKMPSALTEAWFLTNDERAAQYVANPESLIEPEAQGLADAIAEYLTTSSGRGR
jgi:N-acetylmuramoyl-L-alanine amidase